ncbi:helix-turn-helix transcriptional regulator [Pedobacter hiemivivus]|uniref:AraC family transcriptional regulator n=1 Tax=Pedobacter hiemivivus TaxID=2530454 RepID=A0A4V2MHJ9_9SPHI|nr:AraC family transcriptional regulator [Pedobacter hiemivivus]TCC86726.1 AraC family transcriptional regulator [Pedobacter hiemivivus]TKC62257.1 helix-turn-helix transcriptional regulator [Pedobacter hiemivivus]
MKYNRVLVDKNEVISESTYSAYYPKNTGKYALNVVLSGQANYTIEKREITLVPGSFIFLNHDTSYSNSIESKVEVNTFSVLFDPDFVADFEYSNLLQDHVLLDQPLRFKERERRFVESIHPLKGNIKFNLQHLAKHVENGVNDELLLSEYLNHCLANYYKLYHSEIIKREASLQFLNGTTKVEILKRLTVARDFMISNHNKRIRLEEVAQVACLSVNHLLRTFKQAYQQSPHQFLTGVRLQQAKHFLRNTDYPINEIVDIVGFECPSSFIRLFRNSFQITPGQYR